MKKEIHQSDLDCFNLIMTLVPILRSLNLVEGEIKGINLSDKFPYFKDVNNGLGVALIKRVAVEVVGVEARGSDLIKNNIGRYLVVLVEIDNFGFIRGSGKITLLIEGFETIRFGWSFFNSDSNVLNLFYEGTDDIPDYSKVLLEKVREMRLPKIEIQAV